MNVIEKPYSKYCTLIIHTLKENYRFIILNDLQYTYKQMCKCDFIRLKFQKTRNIVKFFDYKYEPFRTTTNFSIVELENDILTLNIQNIVSIDLKKIDIDETGVIKLEQYTVDGYETTVYDTYEQAKLAYDKFKLEKDSKK